MNDEMENSSSANNEEENKHLYDKVGKGRKSGSWMNQAPPENNNESIGMNARSIVSVVLVLMLLMFVVHCTYVTSNAYSHPSVVLQSHNSKGYVYWFMKYHYQKDTQVFRIMMGENYPIFFKELKTLQHVKCYIAIFH